MTEMINNYEDIITASNNLKIISSELNSISYHLKKLNEDMKIAIKGTAGEYFTNKIVPLGISKTDQLSDRSEKLSNSLITITKTLNNMVDSFDDFNLDLT